VEPIIRKKDSIIVSGLENVRVPESSADPSTIHVELWQVKGSVETGLGKILRRLRRLRLASVKAKGDLEWE